MSNAGGYLVSEMKEHFARREIIIVRCANCKWSYEGPVLATTDSGKDIGALAKQKRHAESCSRKRAYNAQWKRENRERHNEQERRRYAALKAGGKRGRDHTLRKDAT